MPTTELLIAGMECETCGNAVSSVLRKINGVRSVQIRVPEGKAVVEHAAGAPSEEAMIAAISAEGYEADVVKARSS